MTWEFRDEVFKSWCPSEKTGNTATLTRMQQEMYLIAALGTQSFRIPWYGQKNPYKHKGAALLSAAPLYLL
jgi:hypothetical protein